MGQRYKMDSDPHGYCIIFNNEFTGEKKRNGTNRDREALKDLFKHLNYKVIVEENQSAFEMSSHLFQINRKQENEYFDSFVCCFLSHGDENGIWGNDFQSSLQYTTIWSLFGDANSTLRNKPKIFVVQCCQTPAKSRLTVADQRADTVQMDIDNNSLDNNQSDVDSNSFNDVPQEREIKFDQGLGTHHADILFIYASVPGELFFIEGFY